MQIKNIIIAAAAATGVSAGCFSGGEPWGPQSAKDAAYGAVADLCNHGALSGGFGPYQVKTACANLPGNKRANFQVKWERGTNQGLAAGDCILRLNNEIGGCAFGGSTRTADWTFT